MAVDVPGSERLVGSVGSRKLNFLTLFTPHYRPVKMIVKGRREGEADQRNQTAN